MNDDWQGFSWARQRLWGSWWDQTHVVMCSKETLGVSGAYFRACSVKAIQSGVLQVDSFQEQLHSSEVACEYIQYISLLSKCQRKGSFTTNMIDCYGFQMNTNGNFCNNIVFCSMQISEQITKCNL